LKLSQQSFDRDLRSGKTLTGIIDEQGALAAQIKNPNIYLLIKMTTLTFHDSFEEIGGTKIK